MLNVQSTDAAHEKTKWVFRRIFESRAALIPPVKLADDVHRRFVHHVLRFLKNDRDNEYSAKSRTNAVII